ncbi:hypothetical protein GEMRC1_008417 [Eukaryota sp. GEM-RC1]
MTHFQDFAQQCLTSISSKPSNEIEDALNLVLSPSTPHTTRQNAQLFLDQLKSSSPINSRLQLVFSLLSSQSNQLQFFSFSILQHIIDHEWSTISSQEQDSLISFLLGICLSDTYPLVFFKAADIFGRGCRKFLFSSTAAERFLSPSLVGFQTASDEKSLKVPCDIIKNVFENCALDGTRKEVRTVMSNVTIHYAGIFFSKIPDILKFQSIEAVTAATSSMNFGYNVVIEHSDELCQLLSCLSSQYSFEFQDAVLDLFLAFVGRKIDAQYTNQFCKVFDFILSQSDLIVRKGELSRYDFHTKFVDLIMTYLSKFHNLISNNSNLIQKLLNSLLLWSQHPSQKIFSMILQSLSEFERFSPKVDGESAPFSAFGDVSFLNFFIDRSIIMIGKVGYPSKLDESSDIEPHSEINQIRSFISHDFDTIDTYHSFLSQLRSIFKTFFKYLLKSSNYATVFEILLSLYCRYLTQTFDILPKRSQPFSLHSPSIILLDSSVFALESFFKILNFAIVESFANELKSKSEMLLNYLLNLKCSDCFQILFISSVILEVIQPSFQKQSPPSFLGAISHPPHERSNFPSKNTSSTRRKAATSILELSNKCPNKFADVSQSVIDCLINNDYGAPEDVKLYLYESLAEVSNSFPNREMGVNFMTQLYTPIINQFNNLVNSELTSSPTKFLESLFYWNIAFIAVAIKRTLNSVNIFKQTFESVVKLFLFINSLLDPQHSSIVPRQLFDPDSDVSQTVSDEVFTADYLVIEKGSAPISTQLSAFKFVFYHVKGFCITVFSQSSYKYFIFDTNFIQIFNEHYFSLFKYLPDSDIRVFLRSFGEAQIFALPSCSSPPFVYQNLICPFIEAVCNKLRMTASELNQLANQPKSDTLGTEITKEKNFADLSKELFNVFGALFKTDQQFEVMEASYVSISCPSFAVRVMESICSILPIISNWSIY